MKQIHKVSPEVSRGPRGYCRNLQKSSSAFSYPLSFILCSWNLPQAVHSFYP